MRSHRSTNPIHRLGRALLPAIVLIGLTAASAAAHSQTVTPKGNADGFTRPISQPFAQAHCNAQSPALVADASDGVVQFNPPSALPCPEIENPGGQVHPHAGD